MHDVFISHSSKDKLTADAACHALEQAGVRCWMAPRDVTAGVTYPLQISNAIQEADVMVLILSRNANLSHHVTREVGLALDTSSVVIPFRIEPIAPFDDLSYLLHGLHWLDAYPQPVEFAPLIDHVKRNLVRSALGEQVAPSPREPAALASEPIPTVATLANDESIVPGGRFTGMILSGHSFAGLNAKGATLSRSVLRDCDFTAARLDSTILSGAVLEGARLDRASFRDARMDSVNVFGASCIDTDFEFAKLTRADFRRANLTGARFHLIDGNEADFEDCVAVRARFSYALLRSANFSSADLREADFTDAVLDQCCLAGANLTGARGLTAEQLAVAVTDRYTLTDVPRT